MGELNALARRLMERVGRLGQERLSVGDLELRAGDRIVCRRNSDALGVRNGTLGTVAGVHPDRGAVTLAPDRGGEVELPRRYLEAGHVQHAYALTGHAGQGLTVEHAFVLGSDRGRLQEWGYVALSRARKQTHLYVTETVGAREAHFHELDKRDPVTRLAQALEESEAERLASEQRPLGSGPPRGTRPVITRSPPAERERSRLRLLDRRVRDTAQLRARAQRRLDAAEDGLAALGWRGRGGRGRGLRSEIARERSALALAEEKIVELARERKQVLERLTLAEQAPLRGRRPEIAGREYAPERQLSLDLDL
ncbi:MAG: hypothetical protein ACRDOS_00880 [Gaiellaceae bacterium]